MMRIGELAKAAKVTVETIRYYERRGLITQPIKPIKGYRNYSLESLENVLFIKRAQELGFSLEEIANLLALGSKHCLEVQEVAQQKLATVQAKIDDLQRLERVLNQLVLQCQANPDHSSCPIVGSLLPAKTTLKNN